MRHLINTNLINEGQHRFVPGKSIQNVPSLKATQQGRTE